MIRRIKNRKNNDIIYKIAESKANENVDEQKDDKEFIFKLTNDLSIF